MSIMFDPYRRLTIHCKENQHTENTPKTSIAIPRTAENQPTAEKADAGATPEGSNPSTPT